MNKCGVIGTLCVILILMIIAVMFTTRDSRSRLYDAGFNYLEIQKANINNTIHESMKNFETFLNTTSTENMTTSLQPGRNSDD